MPSVLFRSAVKFYIGTLQKHIHKDAWRQQFRESQMLHILVNLSELFMVTEKQL